MSTFNKKLAEVAAQDPRYAYEAYEFMFQALYHSQRRLGRLPEEDRPLDPANVQHHVTARELVEGVCALAIQEFGALAPTVFRQWGIRRTDDFGAIIFHLIQHELMSKTDEDSPADFHDLFNLDEVLRSGFRIELEDA